MKKFLLCTFFLSTFTYGSAQVMPVETQPCIWFRADIPGTTTAQWNNYTDSLHNALPFGQEPLPDTCAFNYHQAFSIDGNSNPFTISDFYPLKKDKYTVFTVFQAFDTLAEYGLWQMQLDSTHNVKLSSHKTKNIRSYIRYSQNGSQAPTINSSSQSWNNIKIDSSICSFTLAGTDSFHFNGKLAEFIVFNNRLTRLDNEKVHTYLALKYGIGIYYLNYVNSQDSTLWDTQNDTTYRFDIIGLGRDDNMGLYQKQTTDNSGSKRLTMYFDTLKYLNQANTSQIDDMNFALFGHNGDSISTFHIDTNNLFVFPSLMNRKWKIALNGSMIHQKPINIRMYMPNIDSVNTLKLIISGELNDEFDPAMCRVIDPSRTDTNGYYYYENIYWDTDFSGSDLFTFSQLPSGSLNRMTNNSSSNSEEENTPQYQELSYKIFPNPSEGSFSVEISARNKTPFSLAIYDSGGKEIYKNSYSGAVNYKIEHNIPNSGNYIINFKTSTINENTKLIVK
jgi:hypothetical protein